MGHILRSCFQGLIVPLPPQGTGRQRQRFSVITFLKKYIQWQAEEKGWEQGSPELLLLPSGFHFQPLCPSQTQRAGVTPCQALRTIFLFSLFREPLLCKFLIFIFVPLSAEVKVLSLRRKQSILMFIISLSSSDGKPGKEVELLGLCSHSSKLRTLRYTPMSSFHI